MIQWGVGSSLCLGKNVADLLLKMALISVLKEYEMSTVVTGSAQVNGDGKEHRNAEGKRFQFCQVSKATST